MPKVLLYITSRIIWTFIFFGTDSNEKRAHVHVGKKGTTEMCKIWLEPDVAVEKAGSLTEKQVNDIGHHNKVQKRADEPVESFPKRSESFNHQDKEVTSCIQ